MDKFYITTGKSPATYSSILLDKKYEDIRKEATNAGILLKETDEKIDEIIKDGTIIKSHAHDVQAYALRLYEHIIRSDKILRYFLILFLIIVIMMVIFFLAKLYISSKKSIAR